MNMNTILNMISKYEDKFTVDNQSIQTLSVNNLPSV